MGRRRLAIATVLAESAAVLSVGIALVLGLLLTGAILFIGVLLPTSLGTKVSFLTLVFVLWMPTYVLGLAGAVRGLRRRPQRDRAYPLVRDDAPALHALVDEVARAVHVTPPRALRLTTAFDLALSLSRGGYELLVGVPLMDVLDADELRARVAMALTRAFGGDPLEARAVRAMTRSAETVAGANEWGFAQVVAATSLNLFSQAIIDTREKRARDEATRLFGATTTSSAVMRCAIYEQFVDDEFWSALVTRHALNNDAPDAVSQLRATIRTPLGLEAWLRHADAAEHPVYRDPTIDPRLEHATPAEVYRDQWVPASDLLPRGLDREVTRAFDEYWKRNVAAGWAEATRVTRSQESELAALEQRQSLDDAEAVRRLELILMSRGAATALPELRSWVA